MNRIFKFFKEKSILFLILALLVSFTVGCTDELIKEDQNLEDSQVGDDNSLEEDLNLDDDSEEHLVEENNELDKDGYYTEVDDVALYLNTFGELPKNFITKKDAMNLGWDSKKGNLWDVTDKMSIGGDKFGNREGNLPKAKNRQYYECDINYNGGYRGSERIVYSNDGLIYYTNDHYKSFSLLYGDE